MIVLRLGRLAAMRRVSEVVGDPLVGPITGAHEDAAP